MASNKNTIKYISAFIILALSLIFIQVSNAQSANPRANAADNIQTFYHNPSYKSYIAITTAAIDTSATVDDSVLVFSTMAVDSHPDYGNNIFKNFAKYSTKEKQLLFLTLMATDNQKAINEIMHTYHYNNNQKPKFTVKDIKQLNINDDPGMLDNSWAAYFATGNDEYLLKIIRYVNENDFILTTGYEMVNRRHLCQLLTSMGQSQKCNTSNTDIVKSVSKRYPRKAKEMLYKSAVVASALWSLQANSEQDPAVDKKITAILNNNPQLDYVKKINEAIKP